MHPPAVAGSCTYCLLEVRTCASFLARGCTLAAGLHIPLCQTTVLSVEEAKQSLLQLVVGVGDVGHPNRVGSEAGASLPQRFLHCWPAMVLAVIYGSLKPFLMRQEKVRRGSAETLVGTLL